MTLKPRAPLHIAILAVLSAIRFGSLRAEDIALKLSGTFFNVMAKPEIQDVIKKVGVIPHPIGPQEARAQMDSELKAFGAIMKELEIIK